MDHSHHVSKILGIFAALALLCSSTAAPAAPRPAVIELFTSQGCSSCPPADALLGQLATRGDVIALAFHVDYWDSLGWRDRFELPLAVNIALKKIREGCWSRPNRMPPNWLRTQAGQAAGPETCSAA